MKLKMPEDEGDISTRLVRRNWAIILSAVVFIGTYAQGTYKVEVLIDGQRNISMAQRDMEIRITRIEAKHELLQQRLDVIQKSLDRLLVMD